MPGGELDQLAGYLHEGRLLILLGAGMGIDAGLPGGEDLARSICAASGHAETTDLETAAERFLSSRPRHELDAHVQAVVQAAQAKADNTAYRLLLGLERLDTVITTNFDTLLESSHTLGEYDAITSDYDLRQSASHRTRRKIIKLYGSIDRAGPYCLTESDIRQRAARMPITLAHVLSLSAQMHLVFVGFRGRDSVCIDWLQALARSDEGRGSRVLVYYVDPTLKPEDRGRFGQLGELRSIQLSARDFFTELQGRIALRKAQVPTVGRSLSPEEKLSIPRASNPFLFWKTDQIPNDELVVDLFHSQPEIATEVLSPGNALIIGGRGTGKSMLLRAMTTTGHLARMSGPSDLRSFTIYVKFARDVQQETKRLAEEEPARWSSYYQQFVNLFVCEHLFTALDKALIRFGISVPRDALLEALNLLRTPPSSPDRIQSFRDAAGHLTLARALLDRSRDAPSYRSGPRALADVVEHIRRTIPPIAHDRFVLLIDDFDGTDEQFGPFALWLTARRFDVKLATAHFASSPSGQSFLQHDEDYRTVDLDYHLLFGGRSHKLPKYIEGIANTRLARFGAAIEMQALLGPSGSVSGLYYGFEDLVRISSGQVSKFLELCKDILIDAQQGIDISPALLTGPIDPRIQNRVVRDHSAVFFQETGRDARRGRTVSALLDGWAEYCKRRADGSTQRTLRFVLRDPEKLSESLRDTLDHCLALGVLQRANLRQPHTGASLTRRPAYRLHRLLCPRYDLHLDDHHQRELSSAELESALTDRAAFVARLIPARSQLALALLGESEVPTDERI